MWNVFQHSTILFFAIRRHYLADNTPSLIFETRIYCTGNIHQMRLSMCAWVHSSAILISYKEPHCLSMPHSVQPVDPIDRQLKGSSLFSKLFPANTYFPLSVTWPTQHRNKEYVFIEQGFNNTRMTLAELLSSSYYCI